MQIVTPALVLREVKVGEADRILLLLTPEQGLISASAKGSLRLKSRLFSNRRRSASASLPVGASAAVSSARYMASAMPSTLSRRPKKVFFTCASSTRYMVRPSYSVNSE